MSTKVTVSLIDHSAELTRTQFYLDDIAADGSNWASITAAIDLLVAGLLVATDCDHVSTTVSVDYDFGDGVPPATVTAQREIAIQVTYRDTVTGEKGRFTVPGPVTGFYPPTGVKGDYIPLDNVIFAAFILVIEANMVSRDGNAIEVVEGRLIGRNS